MVKDVICPFCRKDILKALARNATPAGNPFYCQICKLDWADLLPEGWEPDEHDEHDEHDEPDFIENGEPCFVDRKSLKAVLENSIPGFKDV